MGQCLSSRKIEASSDHDNLVNNLPAHENQRQPEPQLGIPRPRHHNLPLDRRIDRSLKRHVWTHNVDAEGAPPTLRQLERMREEFWDTRVTGRQEAWNTIKVAVEMMLIDESNDALKTAREILRAADITVPTG